MARDATFLQRIRLELGRAARNAPALLGGRPRPPPAHHLPLGRDPLEVHTLVCARDVPMALWSLQSFVAYAGLLPTVVVHDDGTLTDRQRALLGRHFHGITVLDDRETAARMDRVLAPWPACRRARRMRSFHCARKLLDILFFAASDQVLYIDSDILFFRPPDRLLDLVAAGQPCFGADYQDAYGVPRQELECWSGMPVEPCLNAGLLHIPVAAYRDRLDLIERYLAHREHAAQRGDVNRDEQTAHALVMSALGAARLPPAYAIDGGMQADTVSYHFVNDGVQRRMFWSAGVPRIARALPPRLDHLRAAGPETHTTG